MSKFKIGFCSIYTPHDRDAWSGTHYYMLRQLQKRFKVEFLTPFKDKSQVPEFINIKGKRQPLEVLYMKYFAKTIMHKINKGNYDFLFFPNNFFVAFLQLKVPAMIAMEELFPLNLWREYVGNEDFVRLRDALIKKILRLNFHLSFPTEKYKKELSFEGISINAQTYCVPYGANLDRIPTTQGAFEIINDKIRSLCRLLFVGCNWERKGGMIAFNTMKELNRRGIHTELIVCGSCPKDINHPKLRKIGFLDKNKPEELSLLIEQYKKASFFFLPTRFDGFGVVFAEAAAWGLPIISTNTDGVPYVVKNGENGNLLDLEDDYHLYADVIENINSDNEHYLQMCKRSRLHYDNCINWDAWGDRTSEIIESIIKMKMNS